MVLKRVMQHLTEKVYAGHRLHSSPFLMAANSTAVRLQRVRLLTGEAARTMIMSSLQSMSTRRLRRNPVVGEVAIAVFPRGSDLQPMFDRLTESGRAATDRPEQLNAITYVFSVNHLWQTVSNPNSLSPNAWSRDALRQLRELAEAGVPLETIAARLRRTQSAVRNKAGMQGISLRGPVQLRSRPAAPTTVREPPLAMFVDYIVDAES